MGVKIITENRKARHDYKFDETIECGICLVGTEVKSCRLNKANLVDAYGAFRGDELWLMNAHINEYSHGNRMNHAPRRSRKLLLNRRELDKLIGLWKGGISLIPLKMYLKKSHVKVLMGIGKGKKTHDKRETLKRKQADREIARSFRRGS